MTEPVVREEQIDKPALLRRAGIFAELPDEDVAALAKLARVAMYPAGDEIIEEGAEFDEETDGIFVVVDGAVEVRTGTKDGSEGRLLVKLGPGEFFGEMALIDAHPRSASVFATTEVQYLAISRWDFHRRLRSDPDIALRIMGTLAERLRSRDEDEDEGA
jgi:CRP/FNR family transcriptional regulator, cyclic AMP receptor protein